MPNHSLIYNRCKRQANLFQTHWYNSAVWHTMSDLDSLHIVHHYYLEPGEYMAVPEYQYLCVMADDLWLILNSRYWKTREVPGADWARL